MPAYKQRKPVYGGKWQTVRRRILERDNNTCQIGLIGCTTTANTVDHITPVSWGGSWYDETNLRAACANCNGALAVLARKHAPQTTETALEARLTAEPSRDW